MREVTYIVRIRIVTPKNLHLIEEEFGLDIEESYWLFWRDLGTKGYSAFDVDRLEKRRQRLRDLRKYERAQRLRNLGMENLI